MTALPHTSPFRPLTASDLAVLPTRLPTGDVRYELDDGVLVVMAPPGDFHSEKQSAVIIALGTHAQSKGLGKIRGEVGIVLRRNPDRVVGADAAFLTTDQLPAKRSKEGYLETIPKLVIEVRSKNDTASEVEGKVREYLSAGVEAVWVLDDAIAEISVYATGAATRILGSTDLLTAPFLPGFAVPVVEFFA